MATLSQNISKTLSEAKVGNNVKDIIKMFDKLGDDLRDELGDAWEDDKDELLGGLAYLIADQEKDYRVDTDHQSYDFIQNMRSVNSIIKAIKALPSIADSGLAEELSDRYGIGERELSDGFSGWDNW